MTVGRAFKKEQDKQREPALKGEKDLLRRVQEPLRGARALKTEQDLAAKRHPSDRNEMHRER